MAAQVKNDLDALGFDVTIQTDTSPAAPYAAIDGGEAYDILPCLWRPSFLLRRRPDLLLNWWCGDNVWMADPLPVEGVR